MIRQHNAGETTRGEILDSFFHKVSLLGLPVLVGKDAQKELRVGKNSINEEQSDFSKLGAMGLGVATFDVDTKSRSKLIPLLTGILTYISDRNYVTNPNLSRGSHFCISLPGALIKKGFVKSKKFCPAHFQKPQNQKVVSKSVNREEVPRRVPTLTTFFLVPPLIN